MGVTSTCADASYVDARVAEATTAATTATSVTHPIRNGCALTEAKSPLPAPPEASGSGGNPRTLPMEGTYASDESSAGLGRNLRGGRGSDESWPPAPPIGRSSPSGRGGRDSEENRAEHEENPERRGSLRRDEEGCREQPDVGRGYPREMRSSANSPSRSKSRRVAIVERMAVHSTARKSPSPTGPV